MVRGEATTEIARPVETVFDVSDGEMRCDYCGTVLSDEIADLLV